MNYYGRRRYRRSAASRAYRRAYSYYGRSKRRASGNQRAARQQRDTSEVNLNIPTKIDAMNYTLTLREGEIDEKIIHTGTYALNLWDLLRKSEFYQSYANMYDQVKINKATIKLIPFQFPIFSNGPTGGLTGSTAASNNFYNSYTIVTAWDRSGLSDEQLEWVNYSKENQNLIIGDAADSDGLYVNLTGAEVATYSSAISKNVNPNSATSITRTIYPSTISEKSYYVSTADLKKWYEAYDSAYARYRGIENPRGVEGNIATVTDFPPGDPVQGVRVPQYPLATHISAALQKNPAFLQESPSVPFKPTLLVSMLNEEQQIQVTNGSDQTPPQYYTFVPKMTFSVEADIVVTFRGLRKASIVN